MLNSSHHSGLQEHGWTLVAGVVPVESCDAVISAICTSVGASRGDPASWYARAHRPGGMVDLFHAPEMWAIRQHPAVYAVFSELLCDERLWVSIDRANMKPPARPEDMIRADEDFVHVDIDMHEIGILFQGVVALSDTAENGGTFQCVPELWPERKRIFADAPPGTKVMDVDRGDHPTKRVAARAGDMIVWSSQLAHGNSVNYSSTPRFAQYVSMHPAARDAGSRPARAELIQAGALPPWATGDPQPFPLATLTPLGRRLSGIDDWAD